MKNKSELLGLFANIFAVVLLLCFIVLGLNRIGVYSLPESIEDFLGTNKESFSKENEDNSIYDSMDFGDSNVEISSAEINYENAILVLKEVSAGENYSQQVGIKHYSGKDSHSETMKIVRKDGLFDITVFDYTGKVIKHIFEQKDIITVETPADGAGVYVAEFEKGNFQISEECGFILTVDEFLESGQKLDESSFSLHELSDDVYLSIKFDSLFQEHVQNITYTVSLKYGIVTAVECVENGMLVYSMTTEMLDSDEINQMG